MLLVSLAFPSISLSLFLYVPKQLGKSFVCVCAPVLWKKKYIIEIFVNFCLSLKQHWMNFKYRSTAAHSNICTHAHCTRTTETNDTKCVLFFFVRSFVRLLYFMRCSSFWRVFHSPQIWIHILIFVADKFHSLSICHC